MAARKSTANTATRTKTVKSRATVPKPPLERDELINRAKKAQALVEEFPTVKDRLPTALMTDLSNDVEIMKPGDDRPIITTEAVRAATRAQDKAMVGLYKSVSAVRTGIQKITKDAEIRAGYGLKIKISANSLPRLVSAGTTILERAGDNTDEARSLGILEQDLANIETLITAVESADGKQRDLIVAKPKTTRERNAAGNRVWKAIVTISSRGVMAFPLDEEVRARFDVLDDLPKKPAKKK